MTVQFVPATRAAAKARIALAGPSGSGKTYTGLSLACRLADRVAVIDTERGSASKYVGLNGWQFDTLAPHSFSPQSLTEALAVAAGEGYGCILVDSLSHYWMGVDGMLEQVDRRAKGGNNFSGWKEARPDERRMIDALVSYPGHVIVTLRVKTEYVIEQNDRGKSVPKKVGLRPEQREGIEYEFDVIGDLDLDNTLTVSKTRIPMLHGASIVKPGPELAETIRDWLGDGEATVGPLGYRDEALDVDATAQTLRALHERVRIAGLLNAPLVDANGNPTVLGDLIVARGKALAAAAPVTTPEPAADDESMTTPAAGRGEQPRNGARANGAARPAQEQPAAEAPPPDPAAEKARVDLRAKVKAAGIDGEALAARFEQQYGESLKLCRDANRIEAFAKLQNLSASSRVGAANGASQ